MPYLDPYLKHYLVVPVYVVGLLGNVLSAAVWFTQRHREGSARLLLGLSLCDCLTTLSGLAYSLLYFLHYACVVDVFLFVQDVFYFLSCHVTVAVVVQRYVCIAHPFSTATYCSRSRQTLTLVLLVTLTLAQNGAYAKLAWDRYLVCVSEDENGLAEVIASHKRLLFAYLVMNFIPPCLLIVLNVMLLRKLKAMTRPTASCGSDIHEKAKRRVSLMVLWVSFTTLLTYVILMAVNFCVVYHYDQMSKDDGTFFTGNVMILGRDVMLAITSSVNFVFYSCFSQNFSTAIKRRWATIMSRPLNQGHHRPAQDIVLDLRNRSTR